MTKVAVGALTGAALDWLVAKCESKTSTLESVSAMGNKVDTFVSVGERDEFGILAYTPSTDWAQGGPIIERELTKVFRNVGGTWSAMILKDVPIPVEDRGTSLALTRRAQWNGAGPTPLIAAMRCYVASKLGDLIEISEELSRNVLKN